MLIGIDTSVLVGLLDERDIWHTAAVVLQEVVKASGLEPVYFDCVLAESISTLARRLREKRREADLSNLLDRLSAEFPAATLTWLLPDVPRLYSEVMELIRSSGGELNFNDALVALACRERSIEALASFDRDFDTISWLKRVAAPEDIKTLVAAHEKSTKEE
jgi:predicted nucleic acid-binding protein